jgi:hypothetical protein
MSVYRSPKSPYYRYDYVIEGHRFHGTTKCETRREAETFERKHREDAKQRVKELRRAQTSMQLDDVAGRYWLEVGQYHAGAGDTERDLARLVDRLGKTKLLTDVTDADVAALVAWRRGHRVIRSRKRRKEDAPLISNATVNRSTTGVLKKLFTYATAWGAQFQCSVNWKRHMLPEPRERIRELRDDKSSRTTPSNPWMRSTLSYQIIDSAFRNAVGSQDVLDWAFCFHGDAACLQDATARVRALSVRFAGPHRRGWREARVEMLVRYDPVRHGFTVATVKVETARANIATVKRCVGPSTRPRQPLGYTGGAIRGIKHAKKSARLCARVPNRLYSPWTRALSRGGISLVMPSVEMDQGIYTAEAALLAEELDVRLDQIVAIAAPPDALLYAQPPPCRLPPA